MNQALLRLIRLTRALAREEDRRWLDGMAAELPHAVSARERIAWASGAAGILAVSLARRLLPHFSIILLTLAACTAMAYADLQSGSRSPYFALLIGIVAVASFLRPAWPWPLVFALLAAFILPAFLMFSFEGPYAHDSGNTTFPLVPGVAVALATGWLRRKIRSARLA